MPYQIQILLCGQTVTPGPQFFYLADYGKRYETNCYCWLVRGEGRTILVDCGLRDLAEVNAHRPADAPWRWGRAGGPLPDVLGRYGVAPEDVDTLVVTHLHYDHCSNIGMFRNARLLIGRREWEFVTNPPHPRLLSRPAYPTDVYDWLAQAARDRVVLMEDEHEVAPGLRAFWVGGHSLGLMAVQVPLASGRRAVIGSDAVCMYANLERNIPPGFQLNLADAYHALDKIRAAGEVVLPGHDPVALERHEGGLVR